KFHQLFRAVAEQRAGGLIHMEQATIPVGEQRGFGALVQRILRHFAWPHRAALGLGEELHCPASKAFPFPFWSRAQVAGKTARSEIEPHLPARRSSQYGNHPGTS